MKNRRYLVDLLVFLLAFSWFWFWRPYGFYGGDSEYLDRQIEQGIWFRKREPLAVAAMQLSNQMVKPVLGWPTPWCISLTSCFFGAVGVVVLKRLCQRLPNPQLTLALLLSSGYLLLFHGHVEVYALPTLLLAIWILAIHKTEACEWESGSLMLAFTGMAWCHTMAIALFPALLAGFLINRQRIHQEWRLWVLGLSLLAGLYVFTDILHIGHGPGFETLPQFLDTSVPKEYAPLLSLKHLKIKAEFLWIGTHLSLIAAVAWIRCSGMDRVTIQVMCLAVCSLGLWFFLHPDAGEMDWDLFLLPSLPVAYLGARYVVSCRWKAACSVLWFTAFISIWGARIPVWANLSQRGLAEVTLEGYTEGLRLKLDDRYEIVSSTIKVQGGIHTISRLASGERTRWRGFIASPGDDLRVRVPEPTVPIRGDFVPPLPGSAGEEGSPHE